MSKIRLYGLHETDSLLTDLCAAISKFTQPRLRSHEIHAITCYLDNDLESLKKWLRRIRDIVKLTSVSLLFNYTEIFRDEPMIFKKKLNDYARYLKNMGIEFQWKAVRVIGKLSHAKGYLLIQRDGHNGGIRNCCLFIGSSNLTTRGVGLANMSNFEIGYLSTLKGDAFDFLNVCSQISDQYGDNMDNFIFRKDQRLFKYALLSSGYFLNKWQGTLTSEIAVRFKLAENSKVVSLDPDLKSMGFNIDHKTLSRNYLDLSEKPNPPFPGSFRKKYCIETYLGFWTPKTIWGVVENITQNNTNELLHWFNAISNESALALAMDNARHHEQLLIGKKYIEPDHRRLENWKEKVIRLKSNRIRMKRLHWQYEWFLLPYKEDDTEEIDSLYKSFKETLSIKRKKSLTVKMALQAVGSGNVNSFNLRRRQLINFTIG